MYIVYFNNVEQFKSVEFNKTYQVYENLIKSMVSIKSIKWEAKLVSGDRIICSYDAINFNPEETLSK